jgi:hypothetical protein
VKPVKPTPEQQARLTSTWQEICGKIDVQPYRFPLRFGNCFDWGFCIFSYREGWMVLDVLRGEELSWTFYPDDDELLYAYAKSMTFALAGWEMEKRNKARPRKALVHLLHYTDKRFDLRLQSAFHRGQMRAIQVPLIRKLCPEWGERLNTE